MGQGHNYYSVNTWLSYKINEMYYNDFHFIWCAPRFDEKDNPPSSNPREIYLSLIKDVEGKDGHSAKIEKNKIGILKGAEEKLKEGVITDEIKADIESIVAAAEISDFRPVIYVINKAKAKKLVEPVSIKYKANVFSREFKIKKLSSQDFEVIDIINI